VLSSVKSPELLQATSAGWSASNNWGGANVISIAWEGGSRGRAVLALKVRKGLLFAAAPVIEVTGRSTEL